MALELESRYDHSKVESKWYETWEKEGAFSPDYQAKNGAEKKGDYCIVIPPPNVTGQLHVGHALNHTIQDVLIRTARKKGLRTLWQMGMDHAGIATQNRVEKNLRENGESRLTLGREAFVEKIWDWKKHSGGLIANQMRKMGFSVDWSTERFTMDEGLSRSVTKVFVELYNKGLIFQGERIINWCPSESCTTALSNDEVEHVEKPGFLWHLKYPLKDGDGFITVATTRPETMLGDTAVAVHPDDDRYKKYHGKTLMLPLVDREIPIVLDEHVDKDFGSGAVKVTPAHDPNDFEIGKRHNLPSIRVLNDHAKVNENGGPYKDLDRYEARKQIIKDLEAKELLDHIDPHKHAVGTCYRCNQVIEPIMSKQWFVKMKPLAENAIKAVKNEETVFYPRRWENLYFDWLGKIQDWCISRQLWWGHRISVYYCNDCGEIMALEETPEHCVKCESTNIHQDPDVLDTWFSSALWPFSTQGWPEKTDELKQFYPGAVLVTGFDIIFFWVARMIMMGLEFMEEVPFKHIYIHGLMRDKLRQKISKSLGNNIDPLDEIEIYGADAYRFFLMATLNEGKDSVYSQDRLKGYQNFTNKIWNSTRFVMMNIPDDFKGRPDKLGEFKLEDEDYWILERLNETIETMDRSMGDYKFQIATEALYAFVWNHFCDWYIELIKPRMFGKTGEESALAARQTAFYILRAMLGLLHPFMPFITEEIYSYLNQLGGEKGELLITSPWPQNYELDKKGNEAARGLTLIQEVISSARLIRAEAGIPPDKKVPIIVRTSSEALGKTLGE